MKNKSYTLEDFKRWGRKGGLKSKRRLTKEQAQTMVAARVAKRAANRPTRCPRTNVD